MLKLKFLSEKFKWNLKKFLYPNIKHTGPLRAFYLIDVLRNNNIKPVNIAEIGVWRGHTSLILLDNMPEICRFHLIDPWTQYEDYKKSGDNKSDNDLEVDFKICQDRLYFHNKKTIYHRCFSSEAAKKIRDKSLNFAFIDGNHSYEYVKEDISLWWPKIKSGGILSGHDLDWENGSGVRQAVEESFGKENKDWFSGPDMVWWVIKK